MDKKNWIALGSVAAIVIVGVVVLSVVYSQKNKNKNSQASFEDITSTTNQGTVSGEASTNLDDFAKYLTAQGFVMYGSYTCPHCTDQKEAFGLSFQYIKYIECNANGPNANPQACTDAGIEGVPTWIKDGIKYEGFHPIDELKKISGYQP